jgi:hypothetical protein
MKINLILLRKNYEWNRSKLITIENSKKMTEKLIRRKEISLLSSLK